MPEKIALLGGARPNFMKLAPLCASLAADPAFSVQLIHTGQHYDDALAGAFFRDLGLPEPTHSLNVGSASHAVQTARVLERLEPVLVTERPAMLVVVGDVNSTLAGALAAAKLGIPVAHVEAGLRSFDRSMPEEINRLATDAISDLFLVSERSGVENLLREGVDPARVHLVGNLMIDSLRKHLAAARQSGIAARLACPPRYGVVTLHRAGNVDNPAQLRELLNVLSEIASTVPLYFPVHPRTQGRIREAGIEVSSRLHLLDPLGYLDFLGLVAGASVVLTDSGGIQEETTVLGVPCLTLRDNTERPSTIEEGTNRLAGANPSSVLRCWREFALQLDNPPGPRSPQGWDGQAAERCRLALRQFLAVA